MAFNRLTKLGNHHNQKVFIISKRNIASRTPLENPGVGTHLRLLPRRKVPEAQAPLSFPIDRFVHSVVSCKWNCAIHGFCLKHNVFKLHQCCDMHQYIVPFYCWIIVHCKDMPQFVYPLTSYWTFESFLVFGYYIWIKSCEHSHTNFV